MASRDIPATTTARFKLRALVGSYPPWCVGALCNAAGIRRLADLSEDAAQLVLSLDLLNHIPRPPEPAAVEMELAGHPSLVVAAFAAITERGGRWWSIYRATHVATDKRFHDFTDGELSHLIAAAGETPA